MAIAPGTHLGRYEIRSQLGAGGMGEVYLAEDAQLERTIALKILPADVASDRQRMHRFVQEAKAAAALNHPNIAHVYEIGETDGTSFIAMEFIDGETLRQLQKQSQLAVTAILDITIQIASALAAAHEAGIVHRDIKPDNIMLRRDGLVKVLDFGLVKLTEPQSTPDTEAPTKALVHTDAGTVMGTANYMSPEQARGQKVDARTDIWSLGVMLYELTIGRLPFSGATTTDIIASIVKTEPIPLTRFSPELPSKLEEIVAKALEKDREERYQTVKDLLVDMRRLRKRLEFEAELERSKLSGDLAGPGVSINGGHPPIQTSGNATRTSGLTSAQSMSSAEYVASEIKRHKTAAAVILLTLVVAVSVIIYFSYFSGLRNAPIDSIAVMPFVNASGNTEIEYLSDGVTESLINSLSQIRKLSVKARSSVFTYKGKEVSPQQVAKDLSVQAILNGRVQQRGDQVLLSVELVDARTGNQLWGEQYTRRMTDLLSLQSEIARDVSSKLRSKLTGAEEQKIAKNYTQNTEAYQLYLRGRYHWNKRTSADVKKSVGYFQQAIDKDPTYALAYAGLAEGYILFPAYSVGSPNEAYPKARAAALKAIEIDETLAEAHNALAATKSAYEWKFAEAEAEWQKTIALSPNYATGHQWYGEFLLSMGRYDEALAEIRRAQELDPLSLIINGMLGVTYRMRGQNDQAIEQLKKTLELDPNFARTHLFLAEAYQQKGMFEEAADEFGKTFTLIGRVPEDTARRFSAALKDAYKTSGPKGYWRTLAEFLTTYSAPGSGSRPPSTVIARFWAQAGETDKALALLEEAYEKHDDGLMSLKDPQFEPIKSDPRYKDLLSRVGLPQN